MRASQYMIDAILAWMTGTSFPAAPATIYVGTFSDTPTKAGGIENTATIKGTANRTALPLNAQAGDSKTNDGEIIFTAAAAGSGDINGYGIFDAETGGNMIVFIPVATISVSVGHIVKLPDETTEISVS